MSSLLEHLLLWAAAITVLFMCAASNSVWSAVRIYALLLGVGCMWLAWALDGASLIAGLTADNNELQRLGQAGDLFGGINALFAALAFAGVAVAAYFQWRSNRQSHIQTFVSSFYSAIDLLHRMTESLQFDLDIFPDTTTARVRKLAGLAPPEASKPARGRAVFSEVAARIAETSHTWEQTVINYSRLQTSHNYVLGHYFRHLYQILKMIDRQPDTVLTPFEKSEYASALRAQLSTSELALLKLNCSDETVDQGQFRNLLITYRMLEHLPYELVDCVYRARDSGLIVGSLSSMQQFLIPTRIGSVTKMLRGAFGSNPVAIPAPTFDE